MNLWFQRQQRPSTWRFLDTDGTEILFFAIPCVVGCAVGLPLENRDNLSKPKT
jgi:hypothetical protein